MSAKSIPKHCLSEQRQYSLDRLLSEVRACRACESELPFEPRPIVHATTTARLLIVGQAPGVLAHESGIPWNDPSGDRLRQWIGIDRASFYDESRIAIIPIGFCYPGRGQSGDLPPRAECASLWLGQLLQHLPQVQLTLLIGRYAQSHYLRARRKETLTDTVRAWREYRPNYLPLPHPSGRNNVWLRRNPWFETEVLPALRRTCRRLVVGKAPHTR
jgi:uracil-DNA glycosylase